MKRFHFLGDDGLHDFFLNFPEGLSEKCRQVLTSYMQASKGNAEIEELKKRFAVVEPEYLSLKKRIEEAETEKKRVEDERRTKEKLIEEAHEKLLAELKQAHNRVEDVSRPIIKFWSDKSGESVDTLKAWLTEQAKKIKDRE